MKMINANIPKIAVENPIGIMSTKYNSPTQIIHPYHFGDPYSKSLVYGLKNLPPLKYNRKPKDGQLIIDLDPDLPYEVDKGEFVTFSSGKRMAKWYNEASGNGHLRSKTFPGIAKSNGKAMGSDKLEAEDFTPDPISLLESNRNLGYAIDEAISDLIDNSISAGATEISYEMHWNVGQPYFLLKDNGSGMSNKNNELINSFRLGSKNPLGREGCK